MQVLIRYTLDVKGKVNKEQLEKYLKENSPLQITDNEKFEISTEHWEIVEV